MGVRLILNGFFRSGTTILWRILKDGNPDVANFYEPCHWNLFRLIEEERRTGRPHPVHGMVLFEDYHGREALLRRLRWRHPNLGRQMPVNAAAVTAYAAAFHEADAPCILQTNRWHFFLGEIGAALDVPTLQVVRDPRRVHSSMLRGYFGQGARWRRAAKRLWAPLEPNRYFQMHRMAEQVEARHGLDARDPELRRMRNHGWDRFLRLWILCNHHALRDCGPERVFSFESLCRDPDATRRRLFEPLGLRLPHEGLLRSDAGGGVSPADAAALAQDAERLGLGPEFREIARAAGWIS